MSEGNRVDRRMLVETRLDLLEAPEEPLPIDQTGLQHLPHVLEVQGVPALDLGERLTRWSVWRVIRSWRAASLTERSRAGRTSSRKISPGWVGVRFGRPRT